MSKPNIQNSTLTGLGFSAALTTTTVQTTAYTAAVNQLIPCDATSAGFTVTLPPAPADKTRVMVKKIDSSANAITVATSGSDVLNKVSGSTSATLSLQNQAISLQYSASGAIWYVTGDDLPLSQFDSRYVPQLTGPATLVSGASGDLSAFGIVLPIGADPTGTADSYASLQAAITSAISKNAELYIPAGTYKTSAALTAASNMVRIRGAGAGVSKILASTTGYNVLTIGPGSGGTHGVRSNGYLKDISILGAGKPATTSPDYKTCVTLDAAIQFELINVETNYSDVGIDLVDDCYGAIFHNIRCGFGNPAGHNVAVRLRTGSQSGDDIHFWNPWLSGEVASVNLECNGGDGTGGFTFYGGQYACYQAGASTVAPDDTDRGAIRIGKTYDTGATTGSVQQVVFYGGDFEAVFRSYNFRIYVAGVTLKVIGTRFDGTGSVGTTAANGTSQLGLLYHSLPYNDQLIFEDIFVTNSCRGKWWNYTPNSGASPVLRESGSSGQIIEAQSLTTSGTMSIGSGTLAVAALVNGLPSGQTITFSGGGVLTLTAEVLPGATSLTGTLATSSVGSGETSFFTVAKYLGTRGFLDRANSTRGIALSGGTQSTIMLDGLRLRNSSGILNQSTDGFTFTGLTASPAGKRARIFLSGTRTLSNGNTTVELTNGDGNDDATYYSTTVSTTVGDGKGGITVAKAGLYLIQYDLNIIAAATAGLRSAYIEVAGDLNNARGADSTEYVQASSQVRLHGITSVRIAAGAAITLLIQSVAADTLTGSTVKDVGLGITYLGS